MTAYGTITELPGNRAHRGQINILQTRYSWAADHCCDKDVAEIACGAGIGLGMLVENAKSVIGGDIDLSVLKYAEEHYKDRNIKLMKLDACEITLEDDSVDVVVCFEAIYYFASVENFISE